MAVGWKVPSPFPRSTESVFSPEFAVMMSGLPSPSMSAIPTALGKGWVEPVPTAWTYGAPKVPVPSPTRIETVPSRLFAVTMSGIPSLFTSPIATASGPFEAPVETQVAGWKVPSPFPRRM